MARKSQFVTTLPATRATAEMRQRVEAVAEAAEVDRSDIVRDCLERGLPALELQYGLVDLGDVVEDRPEPIRENRAANCFGA